MYQVMRDGGGVRGFLVWSSLVCFAQDAGGTTMQTGTTCGRERFVEMADQQWVPELIGDLRSNTLLGQHSCVQCLFEQFENSILARRVIADTGLHRVYEPELECATQYSGLCQQALTLPGQACKT